MKHKPDERELHSFRHSNCRVTNQPTQITSHHVPPKVPDKMPRPQILKKERRHHEAYHLLFHNAPDFATAVYILRRDWWTDEKGNPINPLL